MKPLPLHPILSGFFLSVLATTLSGQTPAGFEAAGPINVSELLPPSLLSGPHHRVEPLAYADGLNLSYQLETTEAYEPVPGTAALLQRVREIEAIAKLREMNKSEEFAKALVQAGKDKVESVKGLIKDPVGTVKRLPQGASRFFGRIAQTFEQMDAGAADGREVAQSALGVNRKKAELALQLGVSVYTSDPVLQQELEMAARAMAGGALVVNVAGMALDGGVGAAVSAIGINETLQRALIESTPDELHEKNRQQLLQLGAAPETVRLFQFNPVITPWQEAVIVSSLVETGLQPDVFLAQAANAATAQDALYFEQLVLLLKKLHESGAPLTELRLENQILCAFDQQGSLIIPVAADYVQWTALLNQRAQEFLALVKPEGSIKNIRVVLDGHFSPLAGQELARLGVSATGQFLGPLQVKGPSQ